MFNGAWLLWLICIAVIASAAAIPVVLSYKPKRITYLSPEAFDFKMKQLEFDQASEIENAESPMEIDNINGNYDVMRNHYQIRR